MKLSHQNLSSTHQVLLEEHDQIKKALKEAMEKHESSQKRYEELKKKQETEFEMMEKKLREQDADLELKNKQIADLVEQNQKYIEELDKSKTHNYADDTSELKVEIEESVNIADNDD